MCVNKPYSVCCTLWCAFGTVFLTLFYFLGHYDGPCVGNASKCNGNYFIAGVTRPELTSQAVGDLFGGVALGYLFCTLLASGFWVYHDYVKKAVGKRRPYGATTEDVEFSGACVRACARAHLCEEVVVVWQPLVFCRKHVVARWLACCAGGRGVRVEWWACGVVLWAF